MRYLIIIIASMTLAAQAFAGDADHRPSLSADELQAFAEQSTGLGGTMQTFTHAGKEVALVMRSHTSGVRSSDLHVFIHTKDGHYSEVLTRATLYGSHLVAKQVGDTIQVVTDPEQQVLLDFTISGCFDP